MIIIDANSIIYRFFYKSPPLTAPDGTPTGVIHLFFSTLFSLQTKFPEHEIITVFDPKGGSKKRNELFTQYKANRKETPPELHLQSNIIQENIPHFGIQTYTVPNYEADDVIYSLVHYAKNPSSPFKDEYKFIITKDKDLYQLVDDDNNVVIYDYQTDTEIDNTLTIEKFNGLLPTQIKDYLSLTGDTADNIPGVNGIGDKGATALLKEYGSIENIYNNIGSLSASLQKKLTEGKESAKMSLELVELELVSQKEIDEHHVSPTPNYAKIAEFFNKYNLINVKSKYKKLMSLDDSDFEKMPKHNQSMSEFLAEQEVENSVEQEVKQKNITKNIEKHVNNSEQIENFSDFDENIIQTDNIEDLNNDLSLVMLQNDTLILLHKNTEQKTIIRYSIELSQIDLPLTQTDEIEAVIKSSIIKNDNKLICFDYKTLLLQSKIVENLSDLLKNSKIFDLKIINWLIDADSSSYRMTSDETLIDFALRTLHSSTKNIETLQNNKNLYELYNNIELPISYILVDMERNGILIDKSEIQQFAVNLDIQINQIEQKIYSYLSSRIDDFWQAELNLNSTKQLAVILYERLGIKPPKKTKTGYSTSDDALTLIARTQQEHKELIELIKMYRELKKIRSTYSTNLLAYVSLDNRMRCKFNQTGTVTGRISANEPNIHSIPVKTDLGREVRKGFVASNGYKLVGFDYSQIELRILAHLSEDEILLESFKKDLDIHAQTASIMYNIPINEVPSNLRRIAKAVNFGVIYGLSSYGLSEGTELSRSEATDFITAYFKHHVGVDKYLKSITEKANSDNHGAGDSNGIETILGHKRNIRELQDTRRNTVNRGERMALNAPIQGSAADILKLAMIKADQFIKSNYQNNEAKLLLQIHDELIFEVKDSIVDDFTNKMKDILENVYKLKVPLRVNYAVGSNWNELK